MFKGGLPVFIEDSWVPRFLSRFSPIEIGAITLGPFIFSRGSMPLRVRNHEAIHWEQWKECGILLFPILYFSFWFWNLLKYRDGAKAYMEIPFERESYGNERDLGYLFKRKRYAWIKRHRI